MPTARIHQIAAKLETREGVDPWGAETQPDVSDVLTVFEPAVGGGITFNERRIAGASLSRGFDSPARETRQVTFRSDLVGNTTGGSNDAKADAIPPFDPLIRACGFQRVKGLKCTGTYTGKFFGAERVGNAAWSGSPTAWGIAINGAGSGTLFVIPIEGDLTGAATLYGERSGAELGATLTVTETGGGQAYGPQSLKTVAVETGAWSSNPVVGDVVTIQRGAEQVGSAQIIELDTTVSSESAILAIWYGGVENGDVLTTDDGKTATIDQDPVVAAGPSLALYSNRDGMEMRTLGARGDFSLAGESGQILEFAWTFSGGAVDPRDSPLVAGASLTPLQGPRMQGVYLALGYDRNQDGTGWFPTSLPIKGIDFAAGITTEDHRNPTAASGIDTANITDRDPQISFDVDQAGVTAFDWYGLRSRAQPVFFALVLGSEVGNRVAVIIPNGQVMEVDPSEADGQATHSITIKCRRIREAGDDELWICKF